MTVPEDENMLAAWQCLWNDQLVMASQHLQQSEKLLDGDPKAYRMWIEICVRLADRPSLDAIEQHLRRMLLEDESLLDKSQKRDELFGLMMLVMYEKDDITTLGAYQNESSRLKKTVYGHEVLLRSASRHIFPYISNLNKYLRLATKQSFDPVSLYAVVSCLAAEKPAASWEAMKKAIESQIPHSSYQIFMTETIGVFRYLRSGHVEELLYVLPKLTKLMPKNKFLQTLMGLLQDYTVGTRSEESTDLPQWMMTDSQIDHFYDLQERDSIIKEARSHGFPPKRAYAVVSSRPLVDKKELAELGYSKRESGSEQQSDQQEDCHYIRLDQWLQSGEVCYHLVSSQVDPGHVRLDSILRIFGEPVWDPMHGYLSPVFFESKLEEPIRFKDVWTEHARIYQDKGSVFLLSEQVLDDMHREIENQTDQKLEDVLVLDAQLSYARA